MSPRRTNRSNDHVQRKLNVAKTQMREYLLTHEIDASVAINEDYLVVTVYQENDVVEIPSTSRGVRVETKIVI